MKQSKLSFDATRWVLYRRYHLFLYQSLPLLYVKLLLYKNQLSRSSECAANAVQILEVLFQFLIDEFVDYALEIGLQVFKLNSQMIYLQNKLLV